MAEESERRFEALMNKLFPAPPKSKPDSKNTRYGIKTLSGRKRLHSSSAGTKIAGTVLGESGAISAQAPLCRPWDRNDLFGRLSTFKSMTWFAKPQVVSPLECARRGWVNVDVDTIACTSCGARILFSTPCAWTRPQVEKAAMVFSLKLDSGHKLHCPWVNNACTEELAQFPILSSVALIEDYKKRMFSLSQLIALPVVLPAAVVNLGSSQLEQFLKWNKPHEKSMTDCPGDVPESMSSISYYQAQMIISLLGWEPHTLPYKVDFKDGKIQSFKDANVIVTTGEKQKVNIFSLCTTEGSRASGEFQFDPSSVVLDCKQCGASVGLWAFSTIPRPLEYLRFVGPIVVNGKNLSTQVSVQEGSSSNQMHIGNNEGFANSVSGSASFGFTIAGGPPPAKLNYGATISLPIVGENLRARFPTEARTETEDQLQMKHQQTSLESENVKGTSAVPVPDSTLKCLFDAPQTVSDNSDMKESLSDKARTVNTTVSEHQRLDAEEFHCSTPADNIPITPGGGSEHNKQETNEATNYEHGSSWASYHPDNPGRELYAKHIPVPFGPMDKVLPSFSKSIGFDPIKQHRHFCPWIFSTGRSAPGWQQTLTALEQHKELTDRHLSTLIEVDDPVASAERLFTTSGRTEPRLRM